MLLRAVVAFLTLPAVVAGVIPWGLSRLPGPILGSWGWGVFPIVAGLLVLLASVVSFYRRGRGTLAPWDPPKHLVVQDLYRFNRNPMYVGVILIIVGWFLLTGSLWNASYAFIMPIIFHLRVVLYEEPQMRSLFAEDWEHYRQHVPRWGMRLTPYERPAERPHGNSC